MFPIKVRMIIMSHLSDVQEIVFSSAQPNEEVNNRINFCKFLLLKYPNTNTEVDADAEYELFQKNKPC